MRYWLVLLLLVVGALQADEPVRAEVRLVFADNEDAQARLAGLAGELDIVRQGWSEDGTCFLDAFLTGEELAAIRARGIRTEVRWPDLRDKFRAMTNCDPADGAFREFGYFFNYWELRDTLTALANNYSGIAVLDSSLRSLQNRPLYCLKLSDNPATEEGEPQAFFNGATHAREPLGTHACVAFASLLCMGYGHDSLVTWLVNNRELYFIPCMNPDGYVYNSDSGGPSSYWRKNRHIIVSPSVGIDLNRNYGYKWGVDNGGSSPTPSSETYRGPYRLSEPEVAAVGRFESAHKFRTEIDIHTYGRYNMYPWAWSGSAPPEQALLEEIADTFQVNNGYPYTGQWYQTLYPSNGASVDYELSDTAGKFVTYAFSCELGINDFWYGWDNPPFVDAEVALNIPNCYYMTRVGGVFLEPQGMVVNDSGVGNANGELDPGETANLWFRVRNRAVHVIDAARSVTAGLRAGDTLVEVLTPVADFPDIARRSSGDNRLSQIQVRCSPNAVPGSTVMLRLELTFTDDGETIMQPVMFTLVVGSQSVAVAEAGSDSRVSLSVAPNPARGSVAFDVRTGSLIRIYDPVGNLVRSLPVAGAGRLFWDTRDAQGRPVAPGVYFARLIAEDNPIAGIRVLIAQ